MNFFENLFFNQPKPKKREISLALAGGGCKALFALGVGYMLRSWGIQIREISGVSAGSAAALMILSEKEEEGLEYFEELLKRNKRNFYVKRLFFGRRPFPHENMYRRTIRYSIDFEKIRKSGVKIFISAVKAFPKLDNFKTYWNKLSLIPTTMRAVILDEKDKERGIVPKRVKKIIDKWKLEEIIFTNEDIQTPEVAEQIILNSSSIPPVVSFQKTDGAYFLDGGLTNNLLLEYFSNQFKKIAVYYEENTLFGKTKEVLQNVFFIRPPHKLPIKTFDYTDYIGARKTYELGKETALRQKHEILEFLDSNS